ncbi:hypothetical protein SDC9_185912 [bioreactor metagenome]|uniref:Uncharacterized protein n=1 Tax=bioreactor metagenome TaxID=1076179 RepID=A0A645HH78_9ZZZZ
MEPRADLLPAVRDEDLAAQVHDREHEPRQIVEVIEQRLDRRNVDDVLKLQRADIPFGRQDRVQLGADAALALPQRRLRLLALRDVPADADEPGDFPLRVVILRFERLGNDLVAVRVHDRFFAAYRLAAVPQLAIHLQKRLRRIAVVEFIVVLADEVLLGDAGRLLKGFVAAQIDSLLVLVENMVGNRVQQRC